MAKGGYKVIDFKNVNIEVDGDAVVIKGIYNTIESNYFKATLCDNLKVDGLERNARYVSFGVSGGDYVGTFSIDGDVNVLTISINADDEVQIIKR